MDKIIDGVDVSECEHYRAEIETKMPYGEYEIQKDKCHYSGIEVIQNCKGNKGCIYKQLKRLQAENERLKARLRPLEDSYFKGLSVIQIAELAKKSIRITAENRKLEYALQEIRDMATLFHSVNEDKGLNRFKNNILDKINSVIGAE